MTRTRMEIVMGAKHIARNYASIQSTVLIVVTSVCNVYEPLGITVTII